MEELASYADKATDNAYAYGEKSIGELTETYNHYAQLFEDSEIGKMLKDFPGRYYDAMPTVEAAQAGGGGGFSVLTAVLTGGAATGVVILGFVASKASLFAKAGKTISKILKLLERKKKTPDAPIKKPHNEVAKAEVDKPKKEEVKEKEKKKCTICKKEYNHRCPQANKSIRPSYDLNEDKADKDLAGDGGALTKAIVKNPKSEYSKIQDHPWYFQREKDDNKFRSIQAHHIIVSQSMKGGPVREMCKSFGYQINHHSNGVMLPAFLDLACHLAVPMHQSSHKSTITDVKEESLAGYKNYPKAVKFKLEELLEDYEDGGMCKKGQNSKAVFDNEMKKLSQFIFRKIKKFEWTLTSTGGLFKQGGLGCCNETTIPKQKTAEKGEVKCSHRDGESEHEFLELNGNMKIIKDNQISNMKVGG